MNVAVNKSAIKDVSAMEILDSRGNPTVRCRVVTESGAVGVASVPSGASTGVFEAHELRDKEALRYFGAGCKKAVDNVNNVISSALLGMSVSEQAKADFTMISLDGTRNKSNLGANAILSVSLAVAVAASAHYGIPLYRYLGGILCSNTPVPMMNIMNGGAHADNNLDIQEFMISPVGADSFSEGVRMCCEVYASLKNILKKKGLSTAVGDEGGFAPNLSSDEEALELILESVQAAGYSCGKDIGLALDVASSEWYDKSREKYILPKRKKEYGSAELADYIFSLAEKYPIISVEDGAAEDDLEGWRELMKRAENKKITLVGDDFFVTNPERVRQGALAGLANALLVKPNQIGTLTETAEAVKIAKSAGYKIIMSHRSGETEDTFIADLAVALSADFIKSGAPARSERVAKYNRLLEIENELCCGACERRK